MPENQKATKTAGNLVKGGKKGGSRFPRVPLAKALEYADKLVKRTHHGALPAQTILVGVFDNKGSDGEIRVGALGGYGLLDGDKEKGYVATQLARDIVAAPAEDQPPLFRQAFLNAKTFNQLYQTFQADTVSKAKLRQAALSDGVHPETVDQCVDCFLSGAQKAGVGTMTGESIVLIAANATPALAPDPQADEEIDRALEQDGISRGEATEEEPAAPPAANGSEPKPATQRPGVSVNFNLDSTFDTEKLQRQLELLRKYNVI